MNTTKRLLDQALSEVREIAKQDWLGTISLTPLQFAALMREVERCDRIGEVLEQDASEFDCHASYLSDVCYQVSCILRGDE